MSDFQTAADDAPDAEPTSTDAVKRLGDWLVTLKQPAEDEPELVDDERARLERELEAAQQRMGAARERLAARDAEMRAALRAEVVVAQERLDELERRHTDDLRSVREAGRAEAERIIAEARTEVSRIRNNSTAGAADVG